MNTGWEQALEVQAQLLKQITGPFWGEMGSHWLGNRLEKYGRHAMLPSAHALSVAANVVREAEPIFVTAEMLDLTRVAMETFNTDEEVHESDFFLRSGMALLEKPFVALDAEGLETAWSAVTWRYIDLPREASPPEENVEVPSLEVILWWDTSVDDGWDKAHPEQIALAREVYRSWNMRYAVMHATLLPLEFMSKRHHVSQEGDPAASWLTFLRVFNKLLGERIVLKSRMRPHRAVRRSAARLGLEDVKDVVVCELRRARPRGYEWPEAGEGGHLTHRFMVRGHWRNQWYPSLGQHKQKFIPAYVKGPDDAPFLEKKRVWVWDR